MQGFKGKSVKSKGGAAHTARKNRHMYKQKGNMSYKDKKNHEMTAQIVNNIEKVMMEKAASQKFRMHVVKKIKVKARVATAPTNTYRKQEGDSDNDSDVEEKKDEWFEMQRSVLK